MSEAEKKKIEEKYPLQDRPIQFVSSTNLVQLALREAAEFGYQLGKDQVKAALRREIEKRIKDLSEFDEPHHHGIKGQIYEAERILELLDTVEP